jgi:ankyrin repeat protein/polyhydroxyalkanoate synthesis regulator phasin
LHVAARSQNGGVAHLLLTMKTSAQDKSEIANLLRTLKTNVKDKSKVAYLLRKLKAAGKLFILLQKTKAANTSKAAADINRAVADWLLKLKTDAEDNSKVANLLLQLNTNTERGFEVANLEGDAKDNSAVADWLLRLKTNAEDVADLLLRLKTNVEDNSALVADLMRRLKTNAEDNSAVVADLLRRLKTNAERANFERDPNNDRLLRLETNAEDAADWLLQLKTNAEDNSTVADWLLQLKTNAEDNSAVVADLLRQLKTNAERANSKVDADINSAVADRLLQLKTNAEDNSAVVADLLQKLKTNAKVANVVTGANNNCAGADWLLQLKTNAEDNSAVVADLLLRLKTNAKHANVVYAAGDISAVAYWQRQLTTNAEDNSAVVADLLRRLKTIAERANSEGDADNNSAVAHWPRQLKINAEDNSEVANLLLQLQLENAAKNDSKAAISNSGAQKKEEEGAELLANEEPNKTNNNADLLQKLITNAQKNSEVADILLEQEIMPIVEYNSKVEVADLLLKLSAHLQLVARDEHGKTPLLTAAASNSLAVQECILTHPECDTNVVKMCDYLKRNVYHLAVASDGNEYRMNHLKENQSPLTKQVNSELLAQTDSNGDIPLDVAAEKGDVKVVKIILEHTKDHQGHSAILRAASERKLKTCFMIITAAGAQCVNASDIKTGNSALHLAANNGHFEMVNLLAGYALPDNNRYGQNPLHLASAAGHLDVVEYLVCSCESDMITGQDKDGFIPLHYAAKHNKIKVFEFLVGKGSSHCSKGFKGRNVLDVAIDNGSLEVGQAIIQSENWQQAMENEVAYDEHDFENLVYSQKPEKANAFIGSNLKNTPMRRMIRKWPELALTTFERCLNNDGQGNIKFIDDTSELSTLSEERNNESRDASVPCIKVADLDQLKSNHPLSLMIRYHHDKLLHHCLIKSLIAERCIGPILFYVGSIIIYLFLLVLTTGFIHITNPRLNTTRWPSNDSEICEHFDKSKANSHIWPIFSIICVLLVICVFIEIIQYMAGIKRCNIIKDWLTTILDLLCYGCIFIIILPLNQECLARIMCQWVLSAFCLLLSWFNLAIQLRRLPCFGIYIFMLKIIALSFAKLFVLVLVFLTAFASAFFILIENQPPFATVWHAILKTTVMLTGEQDYEDLFYKEKKGVIENPRVHLVELTFALYAIFLPVMCILVLNLLIALAVGDVNKLMQIAEYKQLNLLVDLALDVKYFVRNTFSRRSDDLMKCLLRTLHLESITVPISQNGVQIKIKNAIMGNFP